MNVEFIMVSFVEKRKRTHESILIILIEYTYFLVFLNKKVYASTCTHDISHTTGRCNLVSDQRKPKWT